MNSPAAHVRQVPHMFVAEMEIVPLKGHHGNADGLGMGPQVSFHNTEKHEVKTNCRI